MTLLSEAELNSLRELVESGLLTPVTIQRLTRVQTSEGSVDIFAPLATVDGWLKEMSTPAVTEVGGVQATVPIYRLDVPVGTDIRAADQVVIGGETFNVTDENSEDTYLTHITARLRKAE